MMSEMDVNAIAGTLKLYFRELPEPLFTDEFYPNFAEGIGEHPWPPAVWGASISRPLLFTGAVRRGNQTVPLDPAPAFEPNLRCLAVQGRGQKDRPSVDSLPASCCLLLSVQPEDNQSVWPGACPAGGSQ